jgi:hypothetical protein
MTVPAYAWLWGAHDEFLHHRRRYSAAELRGKITDAGLEAVKVSYFNAILFPLVAAGRIKDKLVGNCAVTGTAVPSTPINTFLRILFGLERFLLKRFNLPFGVSLLCVLKAAYDC